MKNKSIYAILGILNLAPSTGYEIKKYCDRVLSGFWNENFGHIYPTLKKMLADGMIQLAGNSDNEKSIRYGITSKGKNEFQKWLLEDTEIQPVRSEFMLKLLFSSAQPVENVVRMLTEYKELHEKKVERYLAMQEELKSGVAQISQDRVFYNQALLKMGIMSGETVIRWCEETIVELTGGQSGSGL